MRAAPRARIGPCHPGWGLRGRLIRCIRAGCRRALWYARSDRGSSPLGSPMSIVDAAEYLFTSESVTEGHPDKMCDQISDAILDRIITEDPGARVACETATTTGLVLVLGEISTTTYVDFQAVVRDTVRDIGYTKAEYGFDYLTCGTIVSVKEQSPDIAMGVNSALEVRASGKDEH